MFSRAHTKPTLPLCPDAESRAVQGAKLDTRVTPWKASVSDMLIFVLLPLPTYTGQRTDDLLFLHTVFHDKGSFDEANDSQPSYLANYAIAMV
jgi:hypothetical protein